MNLEKIYSVLLILILSLFLSSAIQIDLPKQNFSRGETFIASVTANFWQDITKNQIEFYNTSLSHVNLPIAKEVVKIGNTYYIYTTLPIKSGEYGIRIKDVYYFELGVIKKETLTKTFSISEEAVDFSILPGAKTNVVDSFNVEVRNFKTSNLEIDFQFDSLTFTETVSPISSPLDFKSIQIPITHIISPNLYFLNIYSTQTNYSIPIYVIHSILEPECNEDSDCEEGFICEENKCNQGCRESEDCFHLGEDYLCYNFTCLKKEFICEFDDDCESNLTCINGVCIEIVESTKECETDGECEEGFFCEDNLCVLIAECEEDKDCYEGLICQDNFCIEEFNQTISEDPKIIFSVRELLISNSENFLSNHTIELKNIANYSLYNLSLVFSRSLNPFVNVTEFIEEILPNQSINLTINYLFPSEGNYSGRLVIWSDNQTNLINSLNISFDIYSRNQTIIEDKKETPVNLKKMCEDLGGKICSPFPCIGNQERIIDGSDSMLCCLGRCDVIQVEKEKETNWLFFGIIGLLIFLVIAFIFFKLKKPKPTARDLINRKAGLSKELIEERGTLKRHLPN